MLEECQEILAEIRELGGLNPEELRDAIIVLRLVSDLFCELSAHDISFGLCIGDSRNLQLDKHAPKHFRSSSYLARRSGVNPRKVSPSLGKKIAFLRFLI